MTADALYVLDDPAVADLIRGQGCKAAALQRPFRPEKEAVAHDHSTCGHDHHHHGHDHGHAHHEHGHGDHGHDHGHHAHDHGHHDHAHHDHGHAHDHAHDHQHHDHGHVHGRTASTVTERLRSRSMGPTPFRARSGPARLQRSGRRSRIRHETSRSVRMSATVQQAEPHRGKPLRWKSLRWKSLRWKSLRWKSLRWIPDLLPSMLRSPGKGSGLREAEDRTLRIHQCPVPCCRRRFDGLSVRDVEVNLSRPLIFVRCKINHLVKS